MLITVDSTIFEGFKIPPGQWLAAAHAECLVDLPPKPRSASNLAGPCTQANHETSTSVVTESESEAESVAPIVVGKNEAESVAPIVVVENEAEPIAPIVVVKNEAEPVAPVVVVKNEAEPVAPIVVVKNEADIEASPASDSDQLDATTQPQPLNGTVKIETQPPPAELAPKESVLEVAHEQITEEVENHDREERSAFYVAKEDPYEDLQLTPEWLQKQLRQVVKRELFINIGKRQLDEDTKKFTLLHERKAAIMFEREKKLENYKKELEAKAKTTNFLKDVVKRAEELLSNLKEHQQMNGNPTKTEMAESWHKLLGMKQQLEQDRKVLETSKSQVIQDIKDFQISEAKLAQELGDLKIQKDEFKRELEAFQKEKELFKCEKEACQKLKEQDSIPTASPSAGALTADLKERLKPVEVDKFLENFPDGSPVWKKYIQITRFMRSVSVELQGFKGTFSCFRMAGINEDQDGDAPVTDVIGYGANEMEAFEDAFKQLHQQFYPESSTTSSMVSGAF